MSLPIEAHLPAVAACMAAQHSLILVAEPGAGKTTQIPQLLLRTLPAGQIWVLQPRRLAARLAARRVATELGESVGQRVGYRVRFDDTCGPTTRVIFMTEGLLLRSLLTNSQLDGVAAVVFDEFHGRTLAADVGLAALRHVQQTARPDLHLLVMSATLDVAAVQVFLPEARHLSVPGRQHPVAIEHLPHADNRRLEVLVRAAVGRLLSEGLDGDVLVFLAGMADIRRCATALAELGAQHDLLVLPLHGSLTPAEQDRAVQPAPQRKVILSTNVAETSVTLEGVVAVVDSGLAHVASHSPWSGMTVLQTRPVSQASLAQRAGRAGRTRPGRCLRLFTAVQMRARPAFDTPELQRLDLAETALMLAALRLPGLRQLAFVDMPPEAAVSAADGLLLRLGATDAVGQLTALGRRLAQLPLHPRLGRLLLEAERRGAARLGCLAAAYLSEARPPAGREEARHAGTSDLVVQLSHAERAIAQGSRQLARLVKAGPTAADPEEALAQAVLSGFADRVARRVGAMELQLCQGQRVELASSSVVRDAEYVVAIEAQERQEGSRRRTVVQLASAIEADWLLELGPDAVRENDELVWNVARERVERVSSLRYETLVLTETRQTEVDPEAAAPVLAAAVQAKGLAAFVDLEALQQLRARLACARRVAPDLPAIELDDTTVRGTLTQLCAGCTSFAQLRQTPVLERLQSQWGSQVHGQLQRLAPTHITLSHGRRLPIHYEMDKPPWVESRLQDFFGLAEGPRIAGGQVPLTLHLLAPNQRAVQVTQDLAGFWERHYPSLKKALARRYPRHSWPDDPLHAPPPLPRGKR